MPSYAASEVQLIDDRITQNTAKVTKMGTVTGRDTTGPRVLVAFDGSSGVAQPVKCPESVVVDVGDRVGLVRYESDWTVTVNHTLRTLCDAMNGLQWVSTGTTTSATFVDMPNSPSLEFIKVRDNTFLRIWAGVSMFVSASPTVATIGMHLLSGDGLVSYDETMFHRAGQANIHHDYSSWITTGAVMAGSYVATARWLRLSGAGTLTVDGNDSISIHIKEVVS